MRIRASDILKALPDGELLLHLEAAGVRRECSPAVTDAEALVLSKKHLCSAALNHFSIHRDAEIDRALPVGPHSSKLFERNAVRHVLIGRTLVMHCREAGLGALGRIVVPGEDAIVAGQREKVSGRVARDTGLVSDKHVCNACLVERLTRVLPGRRLGSQRELSQHRAEGVMSFTIHYQHTARSTYKEDGVACVNTVADLVAYMIGRMPRQRQHEAFELTQRKCLVVFPQLVEGAFQFRQGDVVAGDEGLLDFGDALADADRNSAISSVFEELTGGEMVCMCV